MFKNLTIVKKLRISYGVIIVLLLILGIYSQYNTAQIKQDTKDIDERVDKITNAATIRKIIKDNQIEVREILLTDNMKEKEESKKIIEENRKIYKETIEYLEKTTRSDKGKKILAELKEAFEDVAKANNK
ncbi:MCP four helix bundle domain-containing protein, partial [Thermodesulfovibrio sp.]